MNDLRCIFIYSSGVKRIKAGLSSSHLPSLTNALNWLFYASMKMIEYKTATADSWAALDKEVNKMLTQGYQLYGSPYFGENKIEGALHTYMVAQAMVKFGLRENPVPMESSPETLIAP